LTELRIRIIGADSFGSRSMATVVEAGGVKIFVDPGVSFAPRRYGLPPHPVEVRRLKEIRERIHRELEDTDIIIITHYHYDHYLYHGEEAELYRGKLLLVKHPTSNINASQRIRAHRLLKRNRVAELAKEVVYIDNNVYVVDRGLEIHGSPPMPHGPDGTKLGYVVMIMVKCCDSSFAHASDIQGPISSRPLEVLSKWRPDIVFLSGPPTYFDGYRMNTESVKRGLENLKTLCHVAGDTVVADHHFARDIEYPRHLKALRTTCGKILSAAEFMGVSYEPLEALRKELWRSLGETTNSNRAS